MMHGTPKIAISTAYMDGRGRKGLPASISAAINPASTRTSVTGDERNPFFTQVDAGGHARIIEG